MPFHATQVDWSYTRLLEPLQHLPGSKLSRLLRLSIPLLENYCQVYDLTQAEDCHLLELSFPSLFLALAEIKTKPQPSHSFIVAPNQGIYALQHEENKQLYLNHKIDPVTQLAFSRVKWAINDQGDRLIYKTSLSNTANDLAFRAKLSLSLPILVNFLRPKKPTSYKLKQAEFLKPLGTDLFDVLTDPNYPLSKAQLLDILHQCLLRLYEFHSGHQFGLPCLHRDVKFENFLLSETGIVTLIDLDDALYFNNGGVCARQAGTNEYLAPELWDPEQQQFKNQAYTVTQIDKEGHTQYRIATGVYSTPAADMYALGVCFKFINHPDLLYRHAHFTKQERIQLMVLSQWMTQFEAHKRLDGLAALVLMQHFFPALVLPTWVQHNPLYALSQAKLLPITRLEPSLCRLKELYSAYMERVTLCNWLSKYQQKILRYRGLDGFALLAEAKDPCDLLTQWQNKAQQPPCAKQESCTSALGKRPPQPMDILSENINNQAITKP